MTINVSDGSQKVKLIIYSLTNYKNVYTIWKGIASFNQRIYFFISYTERKNRTRIISARLAEPPEKERYDENYQKQIAGYK